MSTIDPTQLDNFVANPPDGSGDPGAPVNYLTSDERSYRVPVQQQISAAKFDIEALETGKENTGTAAAAVSAHDASAAAHGGVEQDFAAHKGAGGTEHAVAVASGAAGFMSGADKTKLDALDPGAFVPDVATADGDLLSYDGSIYYKLPVGTDGQILTARPGGAQATKLVWETPSSGGNVNAGAALPSGELVQGAGGFDVATSGIVAGNVALLDATNEFAALNAFAGASLSGFRWKLGADFQAGALYASGIGLTIAPTDVGGSFIPGGIKIPGTAELQVGNAAGTGYTASAGYLNVENAVTAGMGVFDHAGGTPVEYQIRSKDSALFSNVSHTATVRADGSTNITPAGTGGAFVRLTYTGGAIPIAVPTEATQTVYVIGSAVSVNIDAGYEVVGGPNSGGLSYLQIWSTGTAGEHLAVWSHPA